MNLTIRQAQPIDAAEIVDYFNVVTNEPDSNLLTSPGEFKLTVMEEQKIISDFAAAANSLFLIAEYEGKIAGVLTCRGGDRRANAHCTTLGITVAKAYRGCGVGAAIMQHAMDWAQGSGCIRRMDLYVFSGNQTAIHLYEKFGFVTEGCLRRAVYRDGEFQDDLLMARLF